MRDWYNITSDQATAQGAGERTWAQIMDCWPLIELDLQDRHIDVESGVLHQRSWWWLRHRIADIAQTPGTRTHTQLIKE